MDSYPSEYTENLKFKHLPISKIVKPNVSQFNIIQSLAISDTYGCTFIINLNELIVYETNDLVLMQPGIPKEELKISNSLHILIDLSFDIIPESTTEAVHITINSNNTILAISVIRKIQTSINLHILYYDLKEICCKFLNQNNTVYQIIKAIKKFDIQGNNIYLLDLLWNPVDPFYLIFVTSDGNLIYNNIIVFENKSNHIVENFTCNNSNNCTSICWSPKGKQFIVGSKDGSILQMKLVKENCGLNFQVIRFITSPSPNLSAIKLLWLSTYNILSCYQKESTSDNKEYIFANIQISKNNLSQDQIKLYQDPFFDTKSETNIKFQRLLWFIRIPSWNDMILAVSNTDNTILTFIKDVQCEGLTLLEVEDIFNAVLPVCDIGGSHNVDVYATGIALALTIHCDILFPHSISYPPGPILFVMTDAGYLVPFSIVAIWEGLTSINIPQEILKNNIPKLDDHKSLQDLTTLDFRKDIFFEDGKLLDNYNIKQSTPQDIMLKNISEPSHGNQDKPDIKSNLNEELFSLSLSPPSETLHDTTFDLISHKSKNIIQPLTDQPHDHAINNFKSAIYHHNDSSSPAELQIEKCQLHDQLNTLKEKLESISSNKLNNVDGTIIRFSTLGMKEYLGNNNVWEAEWRHILMEFNFEIKKFNQHIDEYGRCRLLDLLAQLEELGKVFETVAKAEKVKNQSDTANVFYTKSDCQCINLAKSYISNLEQRYAAILDKAVQIRNKITMKLRETDFENNELMCRLKISQQSATYKCLLNHDRLIRNASLALEILEQLISTSPFLFQIKSVRPSAKPHFTQHLQPLGLSCMDKILGRVFTESADIKSSNSYKSQVVFRSLKKAKKENSKYGTQWAKVMAGSTISNIQSMILKEEQGKNSELVKSGDKILNDNKLSVSSFLQPALSDPSLFFKPQEEILVVKCASIAPSPSESYIAPLEKFTLKKFSPDTAPLIQQSHDVSNLFNIEDQSNLSSIISATKELVFPPKLTNTIDESLKVKGSNELIIPTLSSLTQPFTFTNSQTTAITNTTKKIENTSKCEPRLLFNLSLNTENISNNSDDQSKYLFHMQETELPLTLSHPPHKSSTESSQSPLDMSCTPITTAKDEQPKLPTLGLTELSAANPFTFNDTINSIFGAAPGFSRPSLFPASFLSVTTNYLTNSATLTLAVTKTQPPMFSNLFNQSAPIFGGGATFGSGLNSLSPIGSVLNPDAFNGPSSESSLGTFTSFKPSLSSYAFGSVSPPQHIFGSSTPSTIFGSPDFSSNSNEVGTGFAALAQLASGPSDSGFNVGAQSFFFSSSQSPLSTNTFGFGAISGFGSPQMQQPTFGNQNIASAPVKDSFMTYR
ncbi:unnamed protein product [Gordionus sp. m RMFG-2023]|uniref:nuclear pore complex protein Nup214-like n=1 Tax=Gordionus sp. m RMFG-2023 TaxID=3053472 RepID=UPI0030E17979